jgi:hypothetical protein
VEQKNVGEGKDEHVVQHDEKQSRCGVEQAKDVQRMAGRIGRGGDATTERLSESAVGTCRSRGCRQRQRTAAVLLCLTI